MLGSGGYRGELYGGQCQSIRQPLRLKFYISTLNFTRRELCYEQCFHLIINSLVYIKTARLPLDDLIKRPVIIQQTPARAGITIYKCLKKLLQLDIFQLPPTHPFIREITYDPRSQLVYMHANGSLI